MTGLTRTCYNHRTLFFPGLSWFRKLEGIHSSRHRLIFRSGPFTCHLPPELFLAKKLIKSTNPTTSHWETMAQPEHYLHWCGFGANFTAQQQSNTRACAPPQHRLGSTFLRETFPLQSIPIRNWFALFPSQNLPLLRGLEGNLLRLISIFVLKFSPFFLTLKWNNI